MIIGLVGKPNCGKNSVAEYLRDKYGFRMLDYSSDVIDPDLKEEGLEITRENQSRKGMELRAMHGSLAVLMAEKIKEGDYVVSGFRTPDEESTMRELFKSFILISIIADSRVRYERALKRGVKGESKLSYDQFLKSQSLPAEKYIEKVMAKADFAIENNGTEEELHKNIDRLMKRLGKW